MFDIKMGATPTLDELKEWILGIEREAVADLIPFWQGWARKVITEEIARCFATEGYGQWAPLSPAYALAKSRQYPGRTILRRLDKYFRAATARSGLNRGGNLMVAKPDEMIWGIDLGWFASSFGFPYPVVHESRSRGRSTAPRRSVFETVSENRDMQNRLVVAMKDYLGKVVARETQRHFP